MIHKKTLEEVKKRLIKTYNPQAIYLFGSYAWGTPHDDSDLDLLVIVDTSKEKSYKRPIIGHRALRDIDISKDLIIYTKEEFERTSVNSTTLGYKIKQYGELLYARA